MPRIVRILNPIKAGVTHLGFKHAQRHVRQGLAEWVDDSHLVVRFKPRDTRRVSAETAAQRTTRGGYDRIQRRLTMRELRHIPVVNLSALQQ